MSTFINDLNNIDSAFVTLSDGNLVNLRLCGNEKLHNKGS